jgi:hypothetical protein
MPADAGGAAEAGLARQAIHRRRAVPDGRGGLPPLRLGDVFLAGVLAGQQ